MGGYVKRTFGEIAAMGVALVLIGVCVVLVLWNPFADSNSEPEPQATAPTAAGAPGKGQVAPEFQLYDFQHRAHRLSEFRGKPVVLNFWASWCGPCRLEMPTLGAVANRYQGKVQFVGVNLAERDSAEVAKELLKVSNVQYPNLLDQSGKVAALYRIQGIPTTYFLDQKGRVVHMVIGSLSEQELVRGMKLAMGK